MSMILSFFFTIESKQMVAFSKHFLTSTYGWIFQDINFFATKFVNTFGVVLEAQFFIALCNTVITTVVLAIMHMPQLPTLARDFHLSLIQLPVIVSVVPLTFGYSVGGSAHRLYSNYDCGGHALEAPCDEVHVEQEHPSSILYWYLAGSNFGLGADGGFPSSFFWNLGVRQFVATSAATGDVQKIHSIGITTESDIDGDDDKS